ncbi:MAG: 23S rRNA pseudouridine(955/2504/2580) synthase RluC [Natronospirillum sp.]
MKQKSSDSVQYIQVSADQAGQRLDNFLLTALKGAPKSLIYRVIRKGEVRVNKKRAKPLQKLQSEDLIRVPPVRLGEAQAPPVPSKQLADVLRSRVLWDDDAFMVVDKPGGLAVHGGSGISLGLIESLRQLYPEYRFLELVHRLDRDTSGCILIAKKRSALRVFHESLRNKTLDKSYVCAVHGHWPESLKRIDASLRKDVLQSGERMVKVAVDGKASDTRFRVVSYMGQPVGVGSGAATLVAAYPKTGRTHQIRVHALHAGYVIMGDEKYATAEQLTQAREWGVRRLLLHASSLRFKHPLTDQPMQFDAPLPEAFTALQQRLESV